MALFDSGPVASPTRASAPGGPGGSMGSRALDAAPPMPPSQKRAGSVLFTPPANEGTGMGELGGDPMVQDMMASASIDAAIQKLAANHPEAIDALSQLQQSFRQLMAGIMSMQSQGPVAGGLGAPNLVPPLPMQSGPSAGMQSGPGI